MEEPGISEPRLASPSNERQQERFIVILIIALISFTSIFLVVSAYTLEDVFQASLRHDRSVTISRAQSEQREARIGQVRGSVLPSLSVSASANRQGAWEDEYSGASHQESIRFTAEQPLFRGGRSLYAWRGAKATLSAQKAREQVARLKLFLTVAELFYSIQAHEKGEATLAETLALMENRIEELNRRKSIGRSRNAELLSAQSRLADLRVRREALRRELRVARERLASLSGLPLDTPLQFVETPPVLERPLDSYLQSVSELPELRAAEAELSRARAELKVALGAHWPTADLSANLYPIRRGSTEVDWDVGVTLELPLFQGGRVRAEVREARARLAEAELSRDEQRRLLELAIRSAFEETSSFTRQLSDLSSARSIAESNYRNQVREYDLGLVSNLEVLEALERFQDASRALNEGLANAHRALAELSAAAGEIPAGNGASRETTGERTVR